MFTCSRLVARTLADYEPFACWDLEQRVKARKEALQVADFHTLRDVWSSQACLLELTWPDRVELRDWDKVILRRDVDNNVVGDGFVSILPKSKTDRFMAGALQALLHASSNRV